MFYDILEMYISYLDIIPECVTEMKAQIQVKVLYKPNSNPMISTPRFLVVYILSFLGKRSFKISRNIPRSSIYCLTGMEKSQSTANFIPFEN